VAAALSLQGHQVRRDRPLCVGVHGAGIDAARPGTQTSSWYLQLTDFFFQAAPLNPRGYGQHGLAAPSSNLTPVRTPQIAHVLHKGCVSDAI